MRGNDAWQRVMEVGFSRPGLQARGPAAPVANTTDEEACLALVQSGRLSLDQIVQLIHNGQLRAAAGESRRIQVIGSLPGYSDEVISAHAVIASALVARGVAVYVQ